jgi:hypothetical protein
MISPVSALSAAPVQTLALPPYIAAITAADPDADGDYDLGTIIDTFA